MFGVVWRFALIASIALVAMTRTDEDIEYSPWCTYRVPVRLLILRPRPDPCQRHRRFKSSRLYLSLLLLLLAGDIELNPGPTPVDFNITHKRINLSDGSTEANCISCGMPPENLELRSRQIRTTIVKCAVDGCANFVHDHCKSTEIKDLHHDWECQRHSTTSSTLLAEICHPQPLSSANEDSPVQATPSSPPRALEDISGSTLSTPIPSARVHMPDIKINPSPSSPEEPISGPALHPPSPSVGHRLSTGEHVSRPPLHPPSPSPDEHIPDTAVHTPSPSTEEHITGPLLHLPSALPAQEDKPGSVAHPPSEPLPGPSFISVTLMDVMEAIRMTQVKMDKLADEVSQVRQQLRTLQAQDRSRSGHSLTHHGPPVSVSDEQQQLTVQQAEGHLTLKSSSGRLQDTRQQDSEPTSLLIVGDSNVRRLEAVSKHNPARLTFQSISGATIDRVGRDTDQAVERCKATDVVIHVGTNDVSRRGSEQVVRDVLDMAQKIKSKNGARNVYICSVTPRTDQGSYIFSRSESINNRLRLSCSKSTISFIDLRSTLGRCAFSGLLRDRVHYNREGAMEVLKMIAESVDNFLS